MPPPARTQLQQAAALSGADRPLLFQKLVPSLSGFQRTPPP